MNKPIPPVEPKPRIIQQELLESGCVKIFAIYIKQLIDQYDTNDLIISFDYHYDSSYRDYSYNIYKNVDKPNPDYDKLYAKYLKDLEQYKKDMKLYNKYLREQKKIKKQQEIEELEKKLKKLKGE